MDASLSLAVLARAYDLLASDGGEVTFDRLLEKVEGEVSLPAEVLRDVCAAYIADRGHQAGAMLASTRVAAATHDRRNATDKQTLLFHMLRGAQRAEPDPITSLSAGTLSEVLARVAQPSSNGRPNIVVLRLETLMTRGGARAGTEHFAAAVEAAGGHVVFLSARAGETSQASLEEQLRVNRLLADTPRLLFLNYAKNAPAVFKGEALAQLRRQTNIVAVMDSDMDDLERTRASVPEAMLVHVDSQSLFERALWSEFEHGPENWLDEAQDRMQRSIATIRQSYTFGDAALHMTPPPAGAPVLKGTAIDSLIGLPVSFVPPDATGAAALHLTQRSGIPRFAQLRADERGHEGQFIHRLERDLPLAIIATDLMAFNKDLGTHVFEVDAAKRLYAPYGAGKKPSTDAERHVRLTANHALHPAAVAVTRLAFLARLDELQKLPLDDPRRSVLVTSGGCAAGKSNLLELLKKLRGPTAYGAVWDAAGEGEAQENGWLLEAARARGLKVVFGYAENDPFVQYHDVLGRAEVTGRMVDLVTFARSYIYDQRNMKAFLASPAYLEAKAQGMAECVAVNPGPFNKASLSDTTQPSYPNARLLGGDGYIDAADLDIIHLPPVEGVQAEAAKQLDRWMAERQAAGKAVDDYFTGAVASTLKFDADRRFK